MQQELKVVINFKMEKQGDGRGDIEKAIVAKGYKPNIVVKSSKKSIAEYLEKDKGCRHAILLQTFGPCTKYNEYELAELTDERDIQIVILLEQKEKRNKNFLTILYAAGITSAIFQEDREGVSVRKVIDILLCPRSRAKAREYYGIAAKNISIQGMTHERFSHYLEYLTGDADVHPMNRLLHIAEETTPDQMAYFLTNVPSEAIRPLTFYAEFGQLIELLKKEGVRAKLYYKKPHRYRHMEEEIAKADAENKKEAEQDGTAKKEQQFGGINVKKEEAQDRDRSDEQRGIVEIPQNISFENLFETLFE